MTSPLKLASAFVAILTALSAASCGKLKKGSDAGSSGNLNSYGIAMPGPSNDSAVPAASGTDDLFPQLKPSYSGNAITLGDVIYVDAENIGVPELNHFEPRFLTLPSKYRGQVVTQATWSHRVQGVDNQTYGEPETTSLSWDAVGSRYFVRFTRMLMGRDASSLDLHADQDHIVSIHLVLADGTGVDFSLTFRALGKLPEIAATPTHLDIGAASARFAAALASGPVPYYSQTFQNPSDRGLRIWVRRTIHAPLLSLNFIDHTACSADPNPYRPPVTSIQPFQAATPLDLSAPSADGPIGGWQTVELPAHQQVTLPWSLTSVAQDRCRLPPASQVNIAWTHVVDTPINDWVMTTRVPTVTPCTENWVLSRSVLSGQVTLEVYVADANEPRNPEQLEVTNLGDRADFQMRSLGSVTLTFSDSTGPVPDMGFRQNMNCQGTMIPAS